MTQQAFIPLGDPRATTVMGRGAWKDLDGKYRYTLNRVWNRDLPQMVWVMLNPSTADETSDDNTIRRCVRFAQQWGFGSMVVVNLYALIATQPRKLLDAQDPEGPQNPMAWAMALFDWEPQLVVAAWGANAGMIGLPESRALRGYSGPPMQCLGKTAEGFPKHPLRLAATTPLEAWDG